MQEMLDVYSEEQDPNAGNSRVTIISEKKKNKNVVGRLYLDGRFRQATRLKI